MNNKRFELSTGIFICPESWDDDRQQIAGRSEETKILNNRLNKISNRVQDVYSQLESKGEPFATFDVKDKLLGVSHEKGVLEILDIIIKGIEARVGNDYSEGTFKHYKTTKDILKISVVRKFTRSAMLQSADVLLKKYPGEFSHSELKEHIDDLLNRFGNRALGDTVYRVGCDLTRKLYKNDRVLSPLIDGIQFNLPVNKILQTFAFGLCFGARDENGNMFAGDVGFSKALREKGLSYVLNNFCGLNLTDDRNVIKKILSSGWNVSPIKLTLEQVFTRPTLSMNIDY